MRDRFNGWCRILLGSALVLACCFLLAATAAAHTTAALGAEEPADRGLDPNQALGREIFEDIISRRTAAGHGQVPTMAESLAERFRRGGFPAKDINVVPVENSLEQTAALVVRYRGDGSGGLPILLLAHMDVVDALLDDWSIEPYVLTEKDGYFYGRGTTDNKAGVATLTATFLRLKKEGFVPTRDLILAFSGDEETEMLTARALVEDHRALVDAEFALNSDAGGGSLNAEGEPMSYQVQAAEKTYATFDLTFKNRGGHSSAPRADNAIYDLAEALVRLSEYRFAVQSNETTREFFRQSAPLVGGEIGEAMARFARDPNDEAASDLLAERPEWVGITRTTCVATMLRAGHAENALPQTATATVNCRIFTGVPVAEVEAELRQVVDNPTLEIQVVGEALASPASELRDNVLAALRVAVDARYPGTPIIPFLAPYATDGRETRIAGIPTYGVSGIYAPEDDIRAHGRDERIRVDAFYGALDHWYVLLQAVAGPDQAKASGKRADKGGRTGR